MVASARIPALTWDDIACHTKRDDAWIVIDDKVYNASKFIKQESHPGGEVIFTQAGKDATDAFRAYHPEYVTRRKLPKYIVGTVADPVPPTAMQKAYRKMEADVEGAGLYEIRHTWWAFKLFYPVALVALGIYLFSLGSENTWLYVIGGALIGLGQHQAAFIGHDACHTSLTMSYTPDFVISLVWGTLIFGVSSIWWKYTHNQHHVVTNEYDRDPDITHLPFYAVSKYMFLSKGKGLSMSPGAEMRARFLVKLQWATFFPIMVLIARFSMFFQCVAMLTTNVVPTMPWQPLHLRSAWTWAERVLMAAHLVCLVYLYGFYIPEGFRLKAFLMQHIVCGFLHVQLTLSHWDRPTKHSSEEEDNWFVKQVVTGRNIEGNILNEWFYGGLHYQIEHHIYPRMPRHNLRRCRDDFVRPFCKEWNIPYCSTGFWSATHDVWKTLADVASHATDKKED